MPSTFAAWSAVRPSQAIRSSASRSVSESSGQRAKASLPLGHRVLRGGRVAVVPRVPHRLVPVALAHRSAPPLVRGKLADGADEPGESLGRIQRHVVQAPQRHGEGFGNQVFGLVLAGMAPGVRVPAGTRATRTVRSAGHLGSSSLSHQGHVASARMITRRHRSVRGDPVRLPERAPMRGVGRGVSATSARSGGDRVTVPDVLSMG